MSHAIVLPILIPLCAAILILWVRSGWLRDMVALVSVCSLAAVAAVLLASAASDAVQVYKLGNWPAPYGIVLVLDRLSALFVATTAALALPVLLYAIDEEAQVPHFHAFFQMLIAGVNGAFLTGDLFNLFVFFEVLLLASYALAIQGGGLQRTRAGLGYVVLNLVGSACFLIALALWYGALGTLNIADLGLQAAQATVEAQPIVAVAALMLVIVLLLKAALFPLCFWLPSVYATTGAAVAALFVILTKVGIYALLRMSSVVFDGAPMLASLLDGWLVVCAALSIAVGAAGALAAPSLGTLAASLVLVSSGTLLAAVGLNDTRADAALLFYLPHTTLVTGGLFLLSGFLSRQRRTTKDALRAGPSLAAPALSATMFLALALAVSGMPPLSGFVGKLMLLRAAADHDAALVIWLALLLSGFVVTFALARAGSTMFWQRDGTQPAASTAPRSFQPFGLLLLCIASPVLTLAAPAFAAYAGAAADQMAARETYIAAVLGEASPVSRRRRP